MATYQKFNSTVEDLAEGVHDFATDTLKVLLTLVAPVATNGQKSDLTEIAAGDGYTAGGNTCTLVSSSQTGGTYTLVLNDPAQWVATAGTFADFRYAVLYNDSATNDELIAFWDYGSTVSLGAGETFDVAFGAQVLTLS